MGEKGSRVEHRESRTTGRGRGRDSLRSILVLQAERGGEHPGVLPLRAADRQMVEHAGEGKGPELRPHRFLEKRVGLLPGRRKQETPTTAVQGYDFCP